MDLSKYYVDNMKNKKNRFNVSKKKNGILSACLFVWFYDFLLMIKVKNLFSGSVFFTETNYTLLY